jgi:hypothetical protein
MAINQKLIHFNKKEDFLKEVANGNILNQSIVFIKDSKEIFTHEEFYGQSLDIEYCTNNDILRLFDPSIPEEPDTPVEPEVPVESIGSITEDNSIVIDETQLENGTYTLRYVDSNNNIIDNFNEITSFEINN